MPLDHGEQFDTIQCHYDSELEIGRITLDRPDSLNAMSTRTLDELPAAIELFEELDREGESISTRAIILSGAGEEAFSVGVDVNEIGYEHYPFTASSYRRALFSVEEYGAPVIAKIDGYCVGGGLELALMCDFRIASERSELGLPEIDLGIIPSGAGTTQRLPQLIGSNQAKELCMTGEFLSGTEAANIGLINDAYQADALETEVMNYAEQIASKAPLAIRAIKDTINKSRSMGLQQGTDYEYQAYLPLLHTDDYEEGVTAFNKDRDPQWQGT